MHKELLFSVKAFGAVGDKITDDAAAIQRAIDACHEAGGGVVYVGPGEYMTSALHLKSYVTLYLEAGRRPFGKEGIYPGSGREKRYYPVCQKR